MRIIRLALGAVALLCCLACTRGTMIASMRPVYPPDAKVETRCAHVSGHVAAINGQEAIGYKTDELMKRFRYWKLSYLMWYDSSNQLYLNGVACFERVIQ